jgi:hypothetical protein
MEDLGNNENVLENKADFKKFGIVILKIIIFGTLILVVNLLIGYVFASLKLKIGNILLTDVFESLLYLIFMIVIFTNLKKGFEVFDKLKVGLSYLSNKVLIVVLLLIILISNNPFLEVLGRFLKFVITKFKIKYLKAYEAEEYIKILILLILILNLILTIKKALFLLSNNKIKK